MADMFEHISENRKMLNTLYLSVLKVVYYADECKKDINKPFCIFFIAYFCFSEDGSFS